MALQPFDLFEHNKVTLTIDVVDANGDAVNLTGMRVYFYVHDSKQDTDGTNVIDVDTVGGEITVPAPATGQILVALTPTELALDETVEDQIDGGWQVRWENSAGADDTDLLSLPQPFTLRRNRVQAG
jgi:hypothetical protein